MAHCPGLVHAFSMIHQQRQVCSRQSGCESKQASADGEQEAASLQRIALTYESFRHA